MNNITVSIIISTYNDASYLREAIDSVLKQSFIDWELIIFNDNSTDETYKILEEYKRRDSRILVFQNKSNKGLIANLNKGIKIAKGEFIARLDGDDEWISKNKLKKQVEFLIRNPDYVLVGSWARIIDTVGKTKRFWTYPVTNEKIKKYFLIETCFIHSAVLIRTSALRKVGNYDPKDIYAEDYGLWLRLGTLGKVYNIPEYLVYYRLNPKGATKTKYNEQLKTTYAIINRHKKNYPRYSQAFILWQLREHVPQNIKNFASNILKSVN